jgi:hypothetical protein
MKKKFSKGRASSSYIAINHHMGRGTAYR